MKSTIYNLLFVSLFVAMATQLQAQNDTLLWQDFQQAFSNELLIPDFDSVGTNNWVNYDSDGLVANGSGPQNWYWTDEFHNLLDSVPPADSNFVYASISWLNPLADGNRNYLITPPIQITDDQATLHWKSAPLQGPRYADGYTVLVSTTTYDPEAFTDTIFLAAQMLFPLPVGADDPLQNALEADSFNWSPGYIHATAFSDTTYIFLDSDADNAYNPLLEPHSASLAQYAGQTILINFLHDSDDDNQISIDDILVLGTTPPVGVREELENDFRYVLYPNPTINFVNVLYQFKDKVDRASISIVDIQGRVLLRNDNLDTSVGEYNHKFDVFNWPAGTYSIILTVGDQKITKQFVKK